MDKSKYPVLSSLLPFMKNKYFLTFLGFFIWLSFFDRNDFITTWTYRQKLKSVVKEKNRYDEEIARYKSDLTDLQTNHDNLEKYAREKYKMKKDNEVVFLLEEK